MNHLTSILVIDDDESLLKMTRKALHDSEIRVDCTHCLDTETRRYDFYVISRTTTPAEVIDIAELIRKKDDKASIFLACFPNQAMPIRKLVNCHLTGCIDKEQKKDFEDFVAIVLDHYHSRQKFAEVNRKLDELKKEMLDSSSSISFSPA